MSNINSGFFFILTLLIPGGWAAAQKLQKGNGEIIGNVLEQTNGRAIPEASVSLICLTDRSRGQNTTTNASGNFTFSNVIYGMYRLDVSAVGFNTLRIDSIRVRQDRSDFSLNDLHMSPKTTEIQDLVIYAEKPLIQSKSGNITFNAAESPLSEGSSANELLRNVPLVTTDGNGNVLVRGKTPQVLIDDKPVNLNAQQLQDFLDALPGNMIEKIEVMTNPPPEYADQDGGVINIITRKGRVGLGGRLNVYAGTRGEAGANTNLSYRSGKLAMSFNAGEGYNRFTGNGYTNRENEYPDSSDYLDQTNRYTNKNTRPNARFNVDYDLDKHNSLNATVQYNQNNINNNAVSQYTNIDQQGAVYALSDRTTGTGGYDLNPNGDFTFRHSGHLPGEELQVIGSWGYTHNENTLHFFQDYLNPDGTPTGEDSTQVQANDSKIRSYDLRVNYDHPLTAAQQTILSLGYSYDNSNNRVDVVTSDLQSSDDQFVVNDGLSSYLNFLQTKTSYRVSVKQNLGHKIDFTAGTSLSRTLVKFDLYYLEKNTGNTYWNWLPFANLNKTWENQWSATLIYRRTISRPGLDQMNPAINYTDPYNIQFGNPQLSPSLANKFELDVGKNTNRYYWNYTVGLNKVQDVFNQITTLETDGITQTTYENISNRTEYLMSTWAGYTFAQNLRGNLGASYTYSQYGLYDRTVNNYQDNGSFYGNCNISYTPARVWNFSLSCLYNRAGNPQGVSSSTVSMNLGLQRKFFNKKFIVTVSITDPFIEQSTTTHTNGTDFVLDSYNTVQTRNYRLTLSYNINKSIDAGRRQLLKAMRGVGGAN